MHALKEFKNLLVKPFHVSETGGNSIMQKTPIQNACLGGALIPLIL